MQELKNAYKKTSLAYHPDTYRGDKFTKEQLNEIMKAINIAYETLKGLAKIEEAKDSYTEDDEGVWIEYEIIDISTYCRQITNKINSYCVDTDGVAEDLAKKIYNLVGDFAFNLLFMKTRTEIDDAYNRFLTKLKNEYKLYREEFYSCNYIYIEDIHDSLNYDCSVGDFYRQLVYIKNKYSREIKLKKRIDEVIPLDSIPDKIIRDYIEKVIIPNTLDRARDLKFQKIGPIIHRMHEDIKLLYQFYHELNALDIKDIDDEEIHQEYIGLFTDFKNCCLSLQEALNRIAILQENINKYYIKQDKFKREEHLVDAIYQKVLTKFHSVLKGLNPNDKHSIIRELLLLFSMIMDLFDKYRKEKVSIEQLSLLNNITFVNLECDQSLLHFIENPIDQEFNIYLQKDSVEKELPNINGFYAFSSLKDVSPNYVSLDIALRDAIYVGKYANIGNEKAIVLYVMNFLDDIRYLTFKDGMFFVSESYLLSNFVPCEDIIYGFYQDKEMVKKSIKEQVFQSISQHFSRN